MATPNGWTEDDFCGCGALLDARGQCPYCDYAPDVTVSEVAAGDDGSVTEQWSWFEDMHLYYGNETGEEE